MEFKWQTDDGCQAEMGINDFLFRREGKTENSRNIIWRKKTEDGKFRDMRKAEEGRRKILWNAEGEKYKITEKKILS